MRLAGERPNVELRDDGGERVVVLAFPYDPHVVAEVRGIPRRRFDWDRREWWAPADDWAGIHVAGVLERFPELTTSPAVDAWLAGLERRWVARVTTTRHDGSGWWGLRTRTGPAPARLAGDAAERGGVVLAPLTLAGARALGEERSARLDAAAQRCVEALERGEEPPPPARLRRSETVDGAHLRLDVLWDHDAGAAFERLPGAEDSSRGMPLDPWVV